MAEVTSVGGNGVVVGEVKDKSIVSGAGMFVSKPNGKHGQCWFAGKIVKTMQMSNPDGNSIHRIIDVPVTGPDGGKILVDCPAALAAIAEYWKDQPVKHDWIPVMPFNEAKEPIREAVVEMKEIMLEQSRAQTEAFTNLTNVLAQVLSGKAPIVAAPKRRGRPPKSASVEA